MTDLQYSPDPTRQRDLADLGIEADVRTSFGGSRRAVVEMSTDELDHLTGAVDGGYFLAHHQCVSVSEHENAVDEAVEVARQEGYDEALADIEALATDQERA